MASDRTRGSRIRLLGSYLWGRRKTVLAFAGFLLVQFVVFRLYRLPAEPVLYTVRLAVVLGLVLGGIGFWRYARRVRVLRDMRTAVTVELRDLPAPVDGIESAYQDLIRILREDNARIVTERDLRQEEATDYYTLWAHQIKTPIAAMRLLLQSGGTSDAQEDLELELFKIERYAEMVLHYLRMESLSSDLVLREVELSGIVRQALRKYAPVFIRSGIRLDLADFSLRVLTDEKWLVFVIEQILSNSLKYTTHGSVSIHLDPGDPRVLVIEDTGIGIRPEDIPRIFERGFTGGNGRTELGQKSTGIGLYLCRLVLKKLSHPVTVTSEVGRGTAIRIGFANLTEM